MILSSYPSLLLMRQTKDVLLKSCNLISDRLECFISNPSFDHESRLCINKIRKEFQDKLEGNDEPKVKHHRKKGPNSYNNFTKAKIEEYKKDRSIKPAKYLLKATEIWNTMSKEEKKIYRTKGEKEEEKNENERDPNPDAIVDEILPETQNFEPDRG